MWTKLASSVPYESHEILPVMPPKIVVESEKSISSPKLEVTPKNIIITNTDVLKIDSYVFQQIPATDYKYFEIISKNAVLSDKNGQLMLKPLDNKPIEMQFRTERIWKAFIITFVSWALVTIFTLTQLIIKRKLK